VLGLDVQAALNTFQVEIGKISFKDMSADEISKALEAVFSKVADQMAGFAVEGSSSSRRPARACSKRSAARQGLHDHRRRAEVDRQDVRLGRRGLDRLRAKT
jgi:hypothetical protein